jgi:hypothetical protein
MLSQLTREGKKDPNKTTSKNSGPLHLISLTVEGVCSRIHDEVIKICSLFLVFCRIEDRPPGP